MKKIINKDKIKNFAAAGFLTAGLAVGGLHIYDSHVDHTQGLCPLSHVPLIGPFHQGSSMVSDLQEQGIDDAFYTFIVNKDNPIKIEVVSAYWNYNPKITGLYGSVDSEDIDHMITNNYENSISLKLR